MNKDWPKGPHTWVVGSTRYYSVPFTWDAQEIAFQARQGEVGIDRVVIGGPATALVPEVFNGLETGKSYDGVLQIVNPRATRTTTGCPNKCSFCLIGQGYEGPFAELEDWPDLPILCDSNLLAASRKHLERVFDRLETHKRPDFNQGLDARKMEPWIAERLAKLHSPIVRFSLDHDSVRSAWGEAVEMCRKVGVKDIRAYALIGRETPDKDIARLEYIEQAGVLPNPQWLHRLDCMKHNEITKEQIALGWTAKKRTAVMRHFYRRVGTLDAVKKLCCTTHRDDMTTGGGTHPSPATNQGGK